MEISLFGDAREVERGEIGEPVEETSEEREGGIGDCEGESETVGDGEEVFGDEGERFEVAVDVSAVAVVEEEEFEDGFPTFIW